MSWFDAIERERLDEEARARDFDMACDAEGVPRNGRASLRAEHWSSVVQAAQKAGGYAYHGDLRHLVWMFGRVGPEGRATAEAAARLGGWKAAVGFVVAECARLGDEDLAAIRATDRRAWQEALYRAGYEGCVGDEIPDWVDAVWMGYSVSRANLAFDAINTAGPEFKDQLDAAHRLGGWEAVEALVNALLAQGVPDA